MNRWEKSRGGRRHELTIRQYTETRTSTGAITKTASDFATVFGSVEPLRGNELFLSNQLQNVVSHRVYSEWVDGLEPSMDILFEARVFTIQSIVNPQERGRDVELLCTENV
jgi:SPP1 family predicted phage head-tail adaptor